MIPQYYAELKVVIRFMGSVLFVVNVTFVSTVVAMAAWEFIFTRGPK